MMTNTVNAWRQARLFVHGVVAIFLVFDVVALCVDAPKKGSVGSREFEPWTNILCFALAECSVCLMYVVQRCFVESENERDFLYCGIFVILSIWSNDIYFTSSSDQTLTHLLVWRMVLIHAGVGMGVLLSGVVVLLVRCAAHRGSITAPAPIPLADQEL